MSFTPRSPHRPVVIDVAGTALNADDRRRLQHPLTGGLILFGRNWHDRGQLYDLTAEIKSIRPDVLICVDHEGGRVQRFRTDGFTHLPPLARLGERFEARSSGLSAAALESLEIATAFGYVLASELRACGVDFSFTPILDLGHGPSRVIGDRAFHRDPRIASLLAKSLVHGLLQAGMRNCGKHFPGHGFVTADSHVDVPVDNRPLHQILGDDARPYGWLAGSLDAVMPAHVIYSEVDSLPAGFSAYWLQTVLRQQLGFSGAIISDDLSMQGATVAGTPVEAAVKALNAGCDLLLLCNQSIVEGGLPLDSLLDGLETARVAGEWAPSRAGELRRLGLFPQGVPMAWDTLMSHSSYKAAQRRVLELSHD